MNNSPLFWRIFHFYLLCYAIQMIKKRHILSLTALVFVVLCSINLLSLEFLWYKQIWWFDMPMHFFGGMAVFFLIAYVLHNWGANLHFKHGVFVKLIFLTILAGIAWEVYEYLAQIFISHDAWNMVDTLSDLCFDSLGAVAGAFLVKRK